MSSSKQRYNKVSNISDDDDEHFIGDVESTGAVPTATSLRTGTYDSSEHRRKKRSKGHEKTSTKVKRSTSDLPKSGRNKESLRDTVSEHHVAIKMDRYASASSSGGSSSFSDDSDVRVVLLKSSSHHSTSDRKKSKRTTTAAVENKPSPNNSRQSRSSSQAESINKSAASTSKSSSSDRIKVSKKVKKTTTTKEVVATKSAASSKRSSRSSSSIYSSSDDSGPPAGGVYPRSKSLDMINMIQASPYPSTLQGESDAAAAGQPPVKRSKSFELKQILSAAAAKNGSKNNSLTTSSSSNGVPKRHLKRTKSIEVVVEGVDTKKIGSRGYDNTSIKKNSNSNSKVNENSIASYVSSSDDSILGRYVEGMGAGFARADYSRAGTSVESTSDDEDEVDPSKSTMESSDTSLSSDDETLNVIPVAVPDDAGPTTAERWQKFLHDYDDYIRRKLQYAYMIYTLYAVPCLVAYFAPKRYVSMVYFTSLGCIAFVNGWMLTEAVSAFYYTKKQRDLHHSSPEIIGDKRLGAIISAYLPNELSVLIETVRAVQRQIETLPDTATIDIVVSHNGGSRDQRLQFLASLRKIEKEIPERVLLHELHVVSSKSKAENVNAGLMFFELLTVKRGQNFTELAMYDADHQPIPEAFLYALETMQDQKCDMVMGRCCVQDGFKFIAVEFDILYSVAHAGGRMVRGFGFFGGSNGYWDYVTLQETGMDEGMLTEDVDSSFRAQAAGHRMTYDPTIVSYEEAPPSLLALFKQRLRWSQGWGEVTVRQKTLWLRPAPGLTLWSRFCIFLLLPFRELYAYFSSFTVPIAIVSLRRTCGLECLDYRLLGFLVFCAQVPIFMTWSAWYLTKDRITGIHYRMPTMIRKDYYIYILLSYAYEFAKVHSSVLGHARNFLGLNAWVVTKRKSTGGDGDEEEEDDASVIEEVDRPEELVEKSPYAPPVRRLFAGVFDAREYQAPGPPGHALEGWPGKNVGRDHTESYDTDSDDSGSSASSFSIERVSI